MEIKCSKKKKIDIEDAIGAILNDTIGCENGYALIILPKGDSGEASFTSNIDPEGLHIFLKHYISVLDVMDEIGKGKKAN